MYKNNSFFVRFNITASFVLNSTPGFKPRMIIHRTLVMYYVTA